MSMIIDPGAFEARTDITLAQALPFSGYDRIVSLRQIAKVVHVMYMDDEYLTRLLSSVTLTESPRVRPFKDLRVRRMPIFPTMISVGQSFVEERKLIDLQKSFYGIFEGKGVQHGFVSRPAMIIYGHAEAEDGPLALSHYLPPIIERHEHMHALLDGVHRCWTAMTTGAPLEVIKVSGVRVPFPCDFDTWRNVKMVTEKPPKGQRFFNLRPEYYRDLKYVGIDG